MWRFVFLFITLFNFNVFCQNKEYSIIVKDLETQLPVENATIIVLKTKQTLLTNQEGKVTFVLNGVSNIQILGGNYKTLTLRWATLVQNNYEVLIENKNNKIEEIVVSKDHPQKILKKIVSNSIQKISNPHRLKVYVREFFMLNNNYSYYNDGLINFQFSVNQNKINTTLLVEQNRSYGLLDNDVSVDLKGYNLNNIMENYCSFKYFEPILEVKAVKQYDFLVKRYKSNANYYVMYVTPLNQLKKPLDSFEVVYDSDKKLIIEFTISITPEVLLAKIDSKRKVGTKNNTKSYVKVSYRLDGSNYYLLSSKEEIAYDLVLKDKIKNIQILNTFVTTNYNKNKFTYKEQDVFKDKTLFNKSNNIITNYWDISGYTATDEEKEIVKKIEFKL